MTCFDNLFLNREWSASFTYGQPHSERRSYYELFCWLFTSIENFYYANYSHSVFKNVLSCKSAKSQQGTFNFKTFFPLSSLSLQFFLCGATWWKICGYTVLRFVWFCVLLNILAIKFCNRVLVLHCIENMIWIYLGPSTIFILISKSFTRPIHFYANLTKIIFDQVC